MFNFSAKVIITTPVTVEAIVDSMKHISRILISMCDGIGLTSFKCE